MKKSEKIERIQNLWKEYNEVLAERQKAEKEAKALKEKEDGLKSELCALVPEGDELGGVRHEAWEKPSVQYSKAWEHVVEELVPKTKWAQAEEIKDAWTSVRKQRKVKGVE